MNVCMKLNFLEYYRALTLIFLDPKGNIELTNIMKKKSY